MVKNNFSEPQNHQSLNVSRTINFKKIFAHRFENLICTNKPKEFFFEKIFFNDLQPFSRLQNHQFGRHFFPQNINFILFLKGDYLILI